MKCTIDRLELLSLLGKLEFVAKNKSRLSVLQMVLIKAEKGKLTAWANDLEVILTGTVKARVQTAGAICVPLSLISLLKSSKGKTVTLAVKGKSKKVEVDLGNINSTLDFTPAEDYPICDVPVKGKGIVIDDLAHAVGQVAYAMSKEYESRPILAGICFNQKKSGLELVAADGFRLGITKVKARGKFPGQAVIPIKAVAAIQKFVKGPSTVRVEDKLDKGGEIESRKLAFSADGITICTMTIRGTFPEYDKLIPKTTKTLRVSTEALSEAVTTLYRLNVTSEIIRLQTKKSIFMVSGTIEGNETRIKVSGKGNAQIAFNARNLLDIIRLMGKETMLQSSTPGNPGMFKYNGTIHVLMPMFVQW